MDPCRLQMRRKEEEGASRYIGLCDSPLQSWLSSLAIHIVRPIEKLKDLLY